MSHVSRVGVGRYRIAALVGFLVLHISLEITSAQQRSPASSTHTPQLHASYSSIPQGDQRLSKQPSSPTEQSQSTSPSSPRLERHIVVASLPIAPSPMMPAPAAPASYSGSIMIQNETDLAHHIQAATGPTTVTLLLPAALLLTKALPQVLGPLQLVATGGLVTCATPDFTALTVNTSSFGITGLTWVDCGTVLSLASLPTGTDSNVSISSCSFQGNSIDSAAVSNLFWTGVALLS